MLRFFRPRRSAPIARERLTILLEHERSVIGKSDLVNVLREEILAVIARHVSVEADKVKVTTDKDDKVSTLTVDIELPLETVEAKAA